MKPAAARLSLSPAMPSLELLAVAVFAALPAGIEATLGVTTPALASGHSVVRR